MAGKAALMEKLTAKRKVLALCCCVVLALILSLFFDLTFDTNDDYAIRDILSGAYTGTPDGHCIQLLYPLGFVLAKLYFLVPAVPWFGLVLCLFQWISVFIIALAVDRVCPIKKLTPLVPLIIVALFIREMVFIQYTFTAGMMMAAVCARIYSYRADWVTVFMAVLSFCLRSEMMLLLCPFILIALLGSNGLNKGVSLKKQLPCIALMVIFMGAALISDNMAYSSPEWKEFRELFDARTSLYDFYGIPSYQDNRDIYAELDLTKQDWELLENYNIELSLRINKDSLMSLAAHAAMNRPLKPLRQLYEAVYAYVYRFIHGQEIVYDLLAFMGYLYLFWAARFPRGFSLVKKNRASSGNGNKKSIILGAAGLFLLRCALWIFLLYRGRVPERITHPMYMTEISLLALFILSFVLTMGTDPSPRGTGPVPLGTDPSASSRGTDPVPLGTDPSPKGTDPSPKGTDPSPRGTDPKPLFTPLPLFIIIFLCGGFMGGQTLNRDYALRQDKNKEWDEIRQYCRDNPDKLYHFDVYSTVAYTEKIFIDPVFNRDGAYRNYDTAGGWRVKSPLTAQRLSNYGLSPQNQYTGEFLIINNPDVTQNPIPGDFGTKIRALEDGTHGPFTVTLYEGK